MEIKESFTRSDIVVLITDIKNNVQIEQSLKKLENSFPELKINFDLNESKLPYPCGHTVLRIEGKNIHADKIKATISRLGFHFDALEDKVCA